MTTAPLRRRTVELVPRIQLVVTYFDNQVMYYPIPAGGSWRIDTASRCVVIGKFPRTYIPLDQIRSFDVEALPLTQETS